jgi:hypothetical protein
VQNDEVSNVIDNLKPVVDELADAAFERRPDAAAVRMRAGASTPGPRRVRRWRPIIIAGTAVAAGAAVVAAMALPGGGQGGREGGTGGDEALNTRTFLLASAETAAKQPAAHGNCWYTRTRMWQDLLPFKPGPGVPTPRGALRTFQAQTAGSFEDWKCTLPGGSDMRFRSHGPLDVRADFPTKKDESAWRAAGSPALPVNGGTTESKPSTTTYDKGSHLVNPVIGSHEIEWKSIAKLPATKNGLESRLRKLWQQDRRGGANGYVAPAGFGQYVFVSAWDLFMAPTTPGTRAALYRILADCPSLHATGRIKDRMGRSGVAIGAGDVRLTVDPATAQLLDFEQLADGNSVEYLAFERQGWVDKIGTVPAS